MFSKHQGNRFKTIQASSILALSSLVVLALFLWQGHKGFSLWDEGYLWYGAQRVMLGEVPIRDFMSYDPGRYYWSAALMSLWGDNGIMALRGAVAVFQVIGLFAGLLLIARSTKNQNFVYLLLAAATLALWMFPRHKLFDISLSILLIGVLAFLVRNPTSMRYFFVGMCIGLVAVFGRNHGGIWCCGQHRRHGLANNQTSGSAWVYKGIYALGCWRNRWLCPCASHDLASAAFRHGLLGKHPLPVRSQGH
jgi:hypothetical protein